MRKATYVVAVSLILFVITIPNLGAQTSSLAKVKISNAKYPSTVSLQGSITVVLNIALETYTAYNWAQLIVTLGDTGPTGQYVLSTPTGTPLACQQNNSTWIIGLGICLVPNIKGVSSIETVTFTFDAPSSKEGNWSMIASATLYYDFGAVADDHALISINVGGGGSPDYATILAVAVVVFILVALAVLVILLFRKKSLRQSSAIAEPNTCLCSN